MAYRSTFLRLLNSKTLVPSFNFYTFSTGNRAMSTVTTREENGIYMIGLNRPEQRNCVNHETAKKLVEVFENFNSSSHLRVAVFYGEGDNFCAGYDLKEVANGKHQRTDEEFVEFIKKYRFLGPTNMRINKPVIAAVEGYAVAGGLELALMADLRVVADTAKMGVFCRRVGVPLIDGGTVRLPQIIGLGRALDMILTGREVCGKEAGEIGLANRVVKKGEALSVALGLARLIMKYPQDCMLTDRDSVYNSLNAPHSAAMEFEYQNGMKVLGKAIQGAQKFAQKSKL